MEGARDGGDFYYDSWDGDGVVVKHYNLVGWCVFYLDFLVDLRLHVFVGWLVFYLDILVDLLLDIIVEHAFLVSIVEQGLPVGHSNVDLHITVGLLLGFVVVHYDHFEWVAVDLDIHVGLLLEFFVVYILLDFFVEYILFISVGEQSCLGEPVDVELDT